MNTVREAIAPQIRAGRIVGAIIIFQMVGSVLVNFVLEAPLFGPPGFLASAAHFSRQLGLAAVLGLGTEALWLAIAIAMLPFFHRSSRSLMLWLCALSVVLLAVAVVENAAVMSMVSLSQAYARATAADQQHFETLRGIVAAARNWPHFLARMLDGCAILVFYAVLYRSSAIPRLLALFGLIAAFLQVCGVGLPLLGHEVIFPLLLPLGLAQITVAGWLLARGFRVEERLSDSSVLNAAGRPT